LALTSDVGDALAAAGFAAAAGAAPLRAAARSSATASSGEWNTALTMV
jgi:hypothetical protein